MAFYTFISKKCEQEAQSHGNHDRLQSFAERIESQQAIDHLEPYGSVFVKKDFGRTYRLIIGKVYDADDCMLIFWHFWPRSSQTYNDFVKRTEHYLKEFESEFDKENLAQIWTQKRQSPPSTSIPELSLAEKNFLFGSVGFDNLGDDWMILESKDWIERTNPSLDKRSGKDLSGYLSQLYQLVFDALDKEDTLIHNDKVGIIYYRFPEQKILYLVAPIYMNEKENIEYLKKKYEEELAIRDTTNIARKARRAYPELILADEELWINEIQRQDEKANLALSEEEIKLLRQEGDFYPLFINGRPGSGKSTILQYLFTKYLFGYSELLNQHADIAPPLYLTYSPDLLEVARTIVSKLLTSNAFRLIQQSRRFTLHEAEEITRQTFFVFRNYLLGLLPDRQNFQHENYINYPRFRKLYEERFSRSANPSLRSMAEIAWHVIRTYIKGIVPETGEFMDTDRFAEFPAKQQSVTQETFRLVYDEVWENWYRDLSEENGYWDDQDLARAVLSAMMENRLPESFQGHSVVFCDEAQDFTRNELRLILRLSVFSRRKLTPDVLNRIPFAFAGDPFQTLNPTGFDWKRTKENLYLTIRDQLDRRQRPTLEFNYHELTFNYRSQKSIVQLCNFIHLLRGIAFQREDLAPQNTWFDVVSDMPVYFDVKSPLVSTFLKNQETNVIIVPCHEGEELEYVQRDPILRTFALDDEGKLVRNILSPMRAKGQEFDRVVLYCFGEACVKDRQYQRLLNLINPTVAQVSSLSADEQIPLEYFINRLYVAASRAQKRILIVDTQEGLNHFWKFFRDYDLAMFVERYRSLNPTHTWDASRDLVRIQEGNELDWEKDINSPLELAEQFMEKGKRTDDAYLLERAAQNFRLAKHEAKAVECEALAHFIRKEFVLAGEKFQQLGNFQRAEECFWRARDYSKICAMQTNTMPYKAAVFMENQQDYDFAQIHALHNEIVDALGIKLQMDKVWGEILETIYKNLMEKGGENDLKPYEWDHLYQKANNFLEKGLLSYASEKYVNALLVRSTTYPQKLEVLQKTGASAKEIITYYQANLHKDLSTGQSEIVFQAFRQMSRYDEAESFLRQFPTLERYGTLLMIYLQSEHLKERIDNLILSLFTFLIRQKEWDTAFDFVQNQHLPLSENILTFLSKHHWGYTLQAAFIKALSVSDELVQAERPTLIRVSDYLAECLLERASAFYELITVEQAGAAMERAGKIIDCLEFYENVWKKQTWPAGEGEQQLAKERWLVCKKRQLDKLAVSQKEKMHISQEIRKCQQEWQIENLSSLPEFPSVDLTARPIPVSSKGLKKSPSKVFSPKEPQKITEAIGSVEAEGPSTNLSPSVTTSPLNIQIAFSEHIFSVEVARAKGKMVIRKQGEIEMVTVTAGDLRMQGSDDDFNTQIETRDQRAHLAHYFIRPWNLSCRLRRRNEAVYAKLYLGDKHDEPYTLRIS